MHDRDVSDVRVVVQVQRPQRPHGHGSNRLVVFELQQTVLLISLSYDLVPSADRYRVYGRQHYGPVAQIVFKFDKPEHVFLFFKKNIVTIPAVAQSCRRIIVVTEKCKNYLLTIAIDMKSPDPSGCCWSYNRIPSSEKLLNSISRLNLWYAFNFFNWTYECPLNAADLCSENVYYNRYELSSITISSKRLRFTSDFLWVGTNGTTVRGGAMALETVGIQSLAFPAVLARIRVTDRHFPIGGFRRRPPGQVLDLGYNVHFVATGRVISEVWQFGKQQVPRRLRHDYVLGLGEFRPLRAGQYEIFVCENRQNNLLTRKRSNFLE